MPSDEPTRRAWTYHYAGRIATIGSSLSRFPWDKTELLLSPLPRRPGCPVSRRFFSSLSYAGHSWPACFSSGHRLFSFRSLGLDRASCLNNQLELVGSDFWTHARTVRDQCGNKGGVDLFYPASDGWQEELIICSTGMALMQVSLRCNDTYMQRGT